MKYYGVFAHGWLQWGSHQPLIFIRRDDAVEKMAFFIYDETKDRIADSSSEEFWDAFLENTKSWSVKEVTLSLS